MAEIYSTTSTLAPWCTPAQTAHAVEEALDRVRDGMEFLPAEIVPGSIEITLRRGVLVVTALYEEAV